MDYYRGALDFYPGYLSARSACGLKNEQYILERLFSISKFLLIHITVCVVLRKTMERGSSILINSIPNVSLSYLKVRWQNFNKTPKDKRVLIQEATIGDLFKERQR